MKKIINKFNEKSIFVMNILFLILFIIASTVFDAYLPFVVIIGGAAEVAVFTITIAFIYYERKEEKAAQEEE